MKNPNPLAVQGSKKKEIELIGEDIRFIKTKLVPNSNFSYNVSTTAYLLYTLSILTLLFPYYSTLFMKGNLLKANDRRKKNALKKSLRILKMNELDSFSTASEAIYVFIQEKFLLPSKI